MLTPDEVAAIRKKSEERRVWCEVMRIGMERVNDEFSLLATIEALREELCGRAVILRHTEYWLGVRTEERDAQVALVREHQVVLARVARGMQRALADLSSLSGHREICPELDNHIVLESLRLTEPLCSPTTK
jgi:hypothetical protein